MRTLEQLLKMTVAAKDKDGNPIEITPEFRVAVQGHRCGGVHILVHPMDHNGATLDFIVVGDTLTPLVELTGMDG